MYDATTPQNAMSAFGSWPRTGTNTSPPREARWRINVVMRTDEPQRKPRRQAGRGLRPGGGTPHPVRSARSKGN